MALLDAFGIGNVKSHSAYAQVSQFGKDLRAASRGNDMKA
jgi:hypothetical protein